MDPTKVFLFVLLIGCSALESFAAMAKLPSGISQELYCKGCIATVKELEKDLSKRSRVTESKVIDAVEGVCVPKKFVSYEYSPPRTVKACKLLIERHEDEIEKIFTENSENKESQICYAVSEACKGVDTTSKPGDLSDIDLTVDGDSEKVRKQVVVDPTTGKTRVEDVDQEEVSPSSKNDKKSKAAERKTTKSQKSKKTEKSKKKEGKTLSKKDKKDKRAKKSKTKKAKKEVKKADDGIERLNIDINDPSSVDRVMQQIKDISKDHSEKLAKKNKKEEL